MRQRCKPAPHPFLLSLKWMAPPPLTWWYRWLVSGLRPDLVHALHQPWFVAEIVALLLIFIATSLSAAVLAFPDLHQKRSTGLGAGCDVRAVSAGHAVCLARRQSRPRRCPCTASRCTISIILVSLLPMAWTFYAMRKFASTHYHLAGGIALLSAFSVGALWLRLHEVNDSIVHVVEWHYLPMLAFGLVGWWLGKMVLKW